MQSALAQVRGRKAKLRIQLRKTRQQAHAVKEDIHTVDAKLTTVKGRLSYTRVKLRSEKAEQVAVSRQLTQAEQQLEATKQQVRRRLRVIYMQGGGGSGLSALIGTQDAGELASRGSVNLRIEGKDRSLFDRYGELKRETAARKRAKDVLVSEVTATAHEEQGETRELAEVRQEKGEVLEGLRTKQADLQEEIRQFDEDEASITSQIEAYSRAHGERHGGGHYPVFAGSFMRPVDAPITSTFGMRYHPILHIVRMHEGIDFGAPVGTPIHAAADGDVIATTFMRGYGHVVMLDHGAGISTVYAHTSAVYVSPGQHVHRGQVIAAVGNSGLSTGPHLHFEVRVNGKPVNPLGHL